MGTQGKEGNPVQDVASRTKVATESATPAAESAPKDGDVIVTREPKPAARFTVRQLPSIVQFSAPTRDEAARLVRPFAQKYRVDEWYSERGIYRLIESYRSRTVANV